MCEGQIKIGRENLAQSGTRDLMRAARTADYGRGSPGIRADTYFAEPSRCVDLPSERQRADQMRHQRVA